MLYKNNKSNTLYVKVKDLIDHIQNALNILNVIDTTVLLEGVSNYSTYSISGKEKQSFVCAVHLDTGSYKIGYGSLNIKDGFTNNSIDSYRLANDLDEDYAIIKGEIKNSFGKINKILLNKKLFSELVEMNSKINRFT